MEFQESLLSKLQADSWTPERCEYIEDVVAELESLGFVVFELAEQFLRSFVGIQLGGHGSAAWADFTPLRATEFLESEEADWFGRFVKCEVAPVGISDRMFLLLGLDGRYFCLSDEWFGFSMTSDLSAFLSNLYDPVLNPLPVLEIPETWRP